MNLYFEDVTYKYFYLFSKNLGFLVSFGNVLKDLITNVEEDVHNMKIERVFKENSQLKVDDILKSIVEEDSKSAIDNFFKSLNIKEIDYIRKGDFTLC